jgi:putative peptide zinc metalloprotease protein
VDTLLPTAGSGQGPTAFHRVPGVILHGRYEGSGFRDERYLVERPDGQVVLVTRLLYLVTAYADGHRDSDRVADLVSAEYGQQLTPAALMYLVEQKLRPAGIIGVTGEVPAEVRRADPLLGVSLRAVLCPPRISRTIGRWFAPLFRPGVILLALIAFAVADAWLLVVHGAGAAFTAALTKPSGVLAVLGLLLAATLFHEVGHAAGCWYGGARPGPIGAGLYLWFPVFYTNVTDAYRLDRVGRLRTDLGGVYFNTVFIVAASAAYGLTDWAPLAVVVIFTHLEILQQLLPVVRFDGYYILGDFAGVPNLFGKIAPILRSLLPGRTVDPQVSDLRRRTRAVVTAWVLVTVPTLLLGLVLLLTHTPRWVSEVWVQSKALWSAGGAALRAGDIAATALAYFSILALTLPLVGMVAVLTRSLLHVGRAIRIRTIASRPASPKEASVDTTSEPPRITPSPGRLGEPSFEWSIDRRLSAASFTEETMLRRRSQPPRHGWRRSVYFGTAGRVNVRPSAAELREQQLSARIRAPVQGARRVVVLSRKGGAGKTTTTVMLGHTFATHRGDRVVALDANPDAGSLAYRVPRDTAATVTTLLADREFIGRYADIRGYTSQAATRLEVVASDDDPRISQALGENDYHRAVQLLDQHYNLILLDTGTGILDSATQGILREAHQIVVVMPPALDGARASASTLDWLEQHGYAALVRGAVAVINAVRGEGGLLELDRVERHFAARCAATVRIPWDRALEAGAQTALEDLKAPTRDAYQRLAAAVADGFSSSEDQP